MSQTKIVICGGHFSPALAVIEELQKDKNFQIVYLGRKYPLEGDKALSLEYQTMKKLGIPFFSLYCGRWQRSFTLYTLPSLFRFPLSIFHSFYLLFKIKPRVILSFGGYVALPVSLAAAILRIPLITHEQTAVLGLTNRLISRHAAVVCLSWQMTKLVPKNIKTVITGNPIRVSLLNQKKQTAVNFGNKSLPLLYITGGSLGSHSLNQVILPLIATLTSRFRIIHQCGKSNQSRDFHLLQKLKGTLPPQSGVNYQVFTHIDPLKVGNILNQAFLVIGRSGANTVTELAATGVPAILVPLPWAADNEQEENAKMLVKLGMAKIIKQENLTPEILASEISEMTRNHSAYKEKALKIKKETILDASKRIRTLLTDFK